MLFYLFGINHILVIKAVNFNSNLISNGDF